MAPAQPAPLVRFEWRARSGNPAPLRLIDGRPLEGHRGIAAEQIDLAVPGRNGEYDADLQATDAAGRIDRSTAVFRVVEGRAREVDLRTEHPSWLDDAVVYGAAPYFFTPADFSGVAARVDEIAALGATVLWLSPVTAAAPGDFGYAVTDQFGLREEFGGERGLDERSSRQRTARDRALIDPRPITSRSKASTSGTPRRMPRARRTTAGSTAMPPARSRIISTGITSQISTTTIRMYAAT